MPLKLNLTDTEIAHIQRLLSSYQGMLRMEMIRAIADRATLLERIAVLEKAARPVCDVEGKYGEKYVRVPHAEHTALADALRA